VKEAQLVTWASFGKLHLWRLAELGSLPSGSFTTGASFGKTAGDLDQYTCKRVFPIQPNLPWSIQRI